MALRLFVLQAVVALAVLGWVRRGPRSLVPWACLLVYLLINVAITARGRGLFGSLLYGDTRYITDALPMAAVTIAVLLTPTKRATQPVDAWMRRHRTVLTAVAVLAIFNSGMLTLSRVVPAFHQGPTQKYVANVRASLADNPDAVIHDGVVPGDVILPFFGESNNTVKNVLDAYDLHPRYDVTSPSMKVIDDQGFVRPIALVFTSQAVINELRDCGIALGEGDSRTLPMGTYVTPGSRLMKITYFTSGHGALRVGYPGHTYDVGLDVGASSVYLLVEGAMSAVTLALLDGQGTVCVNEVTVGYPVPDMPTRP